MKKIILLFALLSGLHTYSFETPEEEEEGGFFSSNSSNTTDEEFPDDGEGPPVEDPPVPINGGTPYLMATGVLMAAGYYVLGRKVRKPD